MAQRWSIGLRARLLILALVAVAPAFGLLGYSAVQERARAIEGAKKDAINLVRLVTREQRRLIEGTRERLAHLSRLPAIRRPGAACQAALAEIQKSHPYYANVGVASAGGDVFCSALPLTGRVNIGDRGYFRYALASRVFSIGEYQVGRITRASTINFGYPLLDARGTVHGVVYAALNLGWLEQLITGIEVPHGSVIEVLDRRGTVLAHYPERATSSPAAAGRLSAATASGREGTIELTGADGNTWLYAFGPLSHEAGGNVYVVAAIPTDVAFARMRQDFTRSLVLLSLVSLLVLLAAWVGSETLVLRRVRALTLAARQLKEGDLRARSGLAHGADEIGQLAGTFDDMATALQRTARALKTLSAGNRTLVRATEESALLADMCRLAVEVGGYRFAWIGFAESDERQTVRPVMQFGFDGGLAALARAIGEITWADTERGRGPAGTAIRTGRPYVAQNIAADPNFAPWHEIAVPRNYAAVAAFPLLIRGRAIGALSIYSSEPDAFDTDELELLNEAAEDLAFGIAVLRARVETEQAHATVRRLAYYDALTHLPNRAHFMARLQGELAQAGTSGRQLALGVIEINRWREVSDALGFHHADLLLKEASARVSRALPPQALVARARDNEFAVLLAANGAADAAATLEQALRALRSPYVLDSFTMDIGATAGIALFPRDGSDSTQLLRCADVALQQANRTRKEWLFYEAGYDEESTRRLTMAGELRHAIEAGELVLYYQPKVSMRGNRICGAEALLRWCHAARGMVSPDQFIALAEETGLIKPLTEWVLQTALAQSARWRAAGMALPIAVNLSARNLLDADLLNKLARWLRAHAAHAGALELEITEGAVMEDPQAALRTLTQLHAMGIALFIDDFGTGYSSLSYLKKLPVDAMKIDKSFVLDMLQASDSAAIVRSTIGLAHDLGLKVVAEGVENQAIWDRLATLGCDAAQGYYISKPLPADQFEQWLRNNHAADSAVRR